MPPVAFDRFYKYDELTEILQGWAEERPELYRVKSIGSSYEGREIWLCTLTNFETGPDLEKPGFLIEANIHSLEVTGTTAALHLIDRLLSGYGDDKRVTRVLDTRAFYVIPRLNPDGPELALADRPRFIRSSTRPWPLAEEVDGLYEEDLDGDGRVLMMRVPDPNGSWKPHPDEPRMLDPARARRRGGRVLSRALGGPDSQLRRRHDQDRAAAGRPRSEPELPDGVGRRGRAARGRPVSDFGAGDPRNGAGNRRPAEHHGPHRVPHVQRRSSSALLELPGRALSDQRPPHLPAAGREGDRAHRLPGDLGLPRLQVRPEADCQRRRQRLALRPSRSVLVDDRVLEPSAGSRDRGLPVHRLAARPPARGRPQAPALERRAARRQGLRRLVSLRARPARTGRARRLGPHVLLGERAAPVPAT